MKTKRNANKNKEKWIKTGEKTRKTREKQK